MALTSLQTAYEAHEHTWKVKIEKKNSGKGCARVRRTAHAHMHTRTQFKKDQPEPWQERKANVKVDLAHSQFLLQTRW